MTLIFSMLSNKLGTNLVRPLSKFRTCSTSMTTRTSISRCAPRSEAIIYKTDNIPICAYHNTARNNFHKSLVASARTYSKDAKDPDDKPVAYSTSKAKDWTVDRSFGKGRKSNPTWLVATVSLTMIVVLTWAFFREESEIDKLLGADLNEQLEKINPNLKVAKPGQDPRIAR